MVNKMNMMQISLTELLKIHAGDERTFLKVMLRNYGEKGAAGIKIETEFSIGETESDEAVIIDQVCDEDRDFRVIILPSSNDVLFNYVDASELLTATPTEEMQAHHKATILKAARSLVVAEEKLIAEEQEREQRKESIIDQIQKGMTHNFGVVLSDEPFGHNMRDEMEFAKLPMNLDERDEVFQQIPEGKWACVMMLPHNPMYVSRKNGNYLVAELKDERVITREYESPRCLDDAVAILMTPIPTEGEGE